MSYTFELNNERKDANNVSGKVNAKSPVVEIFSAMANGKDLSRFGNKADVAAKYIMELNSKAVNGDTKAVSELNEIRRFAMEPVLMKEVKLLSIYGNYKNIGYNESCEVEVPDFANIDAKMQAAGQVLTFPATRKKQPSPFPIASSVAVERLNNKIPNKAANIRPVTSCTITCISIFSVPIKIWLKICAA